MNEIDEPPLREPTSAECDANVRLVVHEQEYIAAWYPQMGGYSGKCWVGVHACSSADGEDARDDGFDVYIFHNGEFPFKGERDSPPLLLHHCSPKQFIDFGTLILTLQGPRNIVMCKMCLEVLESRHRHDFVQCKCANNTFTDGGIDYQHIGGVDLEQIEILRSPKS